MYASRKHGLISLYSTAVLRVYFKLALHLDYAEYSRV